MGIPKYFKFTKPFLEYLKDGQQRTIQEIRSHFIQRFRFSEEDLAEVLPSGRQTVFVNRVAWAGVYLKKAGLIDSPARANYVITVQGQQVLKEDPLVIDIKYLSRFESFREFSKKSSDSSVSPADDKGGDDTPDDTFEESFTKIKRSLADDLLTEVLKLSPQAFEQMVLDLMMKMGYGAFEKAAISTTMSGDGGIDGIIMEDKLGFNLIYIQAKRWNDSKPVGRPEIQAFVGAIAGKGGKGLFVTTSTFSRQAIEYAKHQHIILMDGDKLTDYMIEYNFGVSVKKTFEIKSIDTDLFNDYINL